MKRKYCVACRDMREFSVENEIFIKGKREFDYVCSTCGHKHPQHWGKNKTLKYLNLPHDPALIKSSV